MRGIAGTTLLEILVAMIVIGMVAAGIFTAFIFSRKVTWRSSTELSGAGLVTQTSESLRGAIAADMANGLSLASGIYVDQNMVNPPTGATAIRGLNLPDDFRTKFQISPGVTGSTVQGVNHGDGRMVVVENAGEDRDGDGRGGISFDGGATTALRRVRIRIKWTSPTT